MKDLIKESPPITTTCSQFCGTDLAYIVNSNVNAASVRPKKIQREKLDKEQDFLLGLSWNGHKSL